MIEGAPSTALGSTDAGSDRSERVPACSKHAWCVREQGHPDRCWVKLRSGHAPADFGPGRQQLSGRAQERSTAQRDSAPAEAESFASGQLRASGATASGAAPVPAEANAGGAGASNGAPACAHPNTESHWSGLRRCADCRADLTPAAGQEGAT